MREGNFRAELRRIALDQGLAGDAAFVAIGAADLTSISDRRYRELQLAAGLVAGRLHLTAYALGYGASGMTFLDSEIPGLWASSWRRCCSPVSACPSTRTSGAGPQASPSRFAR